MFYSAIAITRQPNLCIIGERGTFARTDSVGKWSLEGWGALQGRAAQLGSDVWKDRIDVHVFVRHKRS